MIKPIPCFTKSKTFSHLKYIRLITVIFLEQNNQQLFEFKLFLNLIYTSDIICVISTTIAYNP